MRSARYTGVAAALLFASLAVLSNGWLQPEGQLIFDSRLTGYSLTDAQTYLASMTADQIALYLGVFRWLDTAFPVLLSLTLVFFLAGSRGHVGVRGVAVAAACGYLFFDLRENALVAGLLEAGTDVSAAQVASASRATVFKWVALAVCVMLTVGALWHGRQRRQSA